MPDSGNPAPATYKEQLSEERLATDIAQRVGGFFDEN